MKRLVLVIAILICVQSLLGMAKTAIGYATIVPSLTYMVIQRKYYERQDDDGRENHYVEPFYNFVKGMAAGTIPVVNVYYVGKAVFNIPMRVGAAFNDWLHCTRHEQRLYSEGNHSIEKFVEHYANDIAFWHGTATGLGFWTAFFVYDSLMRGHLKNPAKIKKTIKVFKPVCRVITKK